MTETQIYELEGTTCPICKKACKTLAGLSKHMNSVHTEIKVVDKKSVTQIINEEIPGLKCSILEVGDPVLWYDTEASEEDVQRLVELMKKLKLNIKIDRRPF
jgi:transaldolase